MSLQEEIKQSSFRNERQKGIINIVYTYNWVRNRLKEFIKPYGITMQQYNVLRILNGQTEAISTAEIRERMLDNMSDASRIVDRLYKKNLVKRTQCPDDRRLVDVNISELGQKLLQQIDRKTAEMDGILKGLEENEIILLNELLDKVRI
ncbi:MAG: MarR family transcriptional regulator [Chitinophagales bacterium]